MPVGEVVVEPNEHDYTMLFALEPDLRQAWADTYARLLHDDDDDDEDATISFSYMRRSAARTWAGLTVLRALAARFLASSVSTPVGHKEKHENVLRRYLG